MFVFIFGRLIWLDFILDNSDIKKGLLKRYNVKFFVSGVF